MIQMCIERKTIAIVGGGASGVLTAYHLAKQNVMAKILIIDPHAELGLGLAYSTPSLLHLLNVPAGKISALPEEPGHFLHWLRENDDPAATPATFAPRAVFGRYLKSILQSIEGVVHVQAGVVDLHEFGSGALLKLSNGREVHAHLVVLATGSFEPAPLPGISHDVVAGGAYFHNAWRPETYRNLEKDAPVTLVGTGLTSVDVVLRLRELGHRGQITALSRHGIFPNRHADYRPITGSAIPAGTLPTCVEYLRALRRCIRSGADWRAAIDSLRATTNELWLALTLKEQKRFRRHLQRRWEVVRHRMAPPIADRIDAELAAGTLVIRKGHLHSVESTESVALVTIRTLSGTMTLTTARVINCAGPDMNYKRVNSSLLYNIFARGFATPGPMGVGLNCERDGALINAAGQPSLVLFNLGPGRLGTLLESIAIPELREQAFELALVLARQLKMTEASIEERGAYCPFDHSANARPAKEAA